MFKEENPELIKGSLPINFQERIITYQDNKNPGLNLSMESLYITKNQKDFINIQNKTFYKEYKEMYLKNKLLKNKLNEVISIKKKLYDTIIKLEERIKINNRQINNNKSNKSNNSNDINNIKNIITYNKKKRIRRKKAEIINKYNCQFPNCNKSYPSKCSLNMHIKLKHQYQNLSCSADNFKQ